MLNSNKIIATSLAVASVSGASIALASAASGAPAGRPNVTALTTGSAATPPASVTAALRSSDAADRGADAADARAISTSAGTWYVAPTNDGACVVAENTTTTCASTNNINAGSLVSFELTGVTGSGDRLRPTGAAIVRGIAPDGVAKAAIIDASGNTLGSSQVTTNAYRIDVSGLSRGSTLKLIDGNGNTADSLALGS